MMPADTARLRLWMDNPNETGAFLALLILGLLAVPCLCARQMAKVKGKRAERPSPYSCAFESIRGSNPAIALAAFLSVGAALVLTLPLAATRSRGAVVALVVSFLCLAIAWRRSRALRWLPVGLLLVAGAVFLVGPGGSRIGSAASGKDRSISSRAEVYSAVPRMAAAAPLGWGLGQSGQAYADWFQPIHQRHAFKHLLGTHATLLVEMGWLPAILAAALCGAALGACFRGMEASVLPDGSHVAGAMLVAFLVAGVFNHVALEPVVCALGLLPAAAKWVADIVLQRPIRSPSGHRWVPATLGAAAPVLIIAIGLAQNQDPVIHRAHDGSVWVSVPATQTIYMAHPDPRVTGSAPGREIRAARMIGACSRSCEALAASAQRDIDAGHSKSDVGCWKLFRVLSPKPGAPPAAINALVLTGRAQGITGAWLHAANRIVWVNPPPPSTIAPELADALRDAAAENRLSVMAGELLGPEYLAEWRRISGESRGFGLTVCPGRGQIVTDFPRRVLELIAETCPPESPAFLSSKNINKPTME